MKTIDRRSKDKKFNLNLILAVLFMMVFVTLLIGPVFYRVDPDVMNPASKFLTPTLTHPLGSDQFGRDILARIMQAVRSVLSIGLGSALSACVIGVSIGFMTALGPRLIKSILIGLIDGMTAFPGLLLAMLVIFVMGKGTSSTLVAISLIQVPVFSKLTYSTVITEMNKLHIQAAKSYGMSKIQIAIKHILPILFPKLLTQLASSIASAIMSESSLSFLGLGVQPPGISLGLMLKEAQKYALLKPHVIVPSGLVLIIIVLGFMLTADLISDRLIKRGEV